MRQLLRSLLGIGITSVLMGCGDDPVVENKSAAAPAASTKKSRKSRNKPKKQPDKELVPPPVDFQEDDFTETDLSRDPFRSFETLFAEKARSSVRTQRTVILEDVNVDDLKLIAVVSRIRPARAMLVDPTGDGHIVHRNDYVGRAERVQLGSSENEYEINWRVDRIRDSDLVLIREDPSNPDVPSATRVIALRPDEERLR